MGLKKFGAYMERMYEKYPEVNEPSMKRGLAKIMDEILNTVRKDLVNVKIGGKLEEGTQVVVSSFLCKASYLRKKYTYMNMNRKIKEQRENDNK